MNTKKFDFSELFTDADRRSVPYNLEGAVIDFTEDMVKVMEDQGISRSELARRIGTSPAYITKILRGSTNFTFESVVKIAIALDCEFKPQLKLKNIAKQVHATQESEFKPWAFNQGSFLHSTPVAPISNSVMSPLCANQEVENDFLAAAA